MLQVLTTESKNFICKNFLHKYITQAVGRCLTVQTDFIFVALHRYSFILTHGRLEETLC